jgi:hypothetical protein
MTDVETIATPSLQTIADSTLWELYARQSGYERVPPTIEEFIASPEYLGDEDRGGDWVWPLWRQALNEVFPNPFFSPYLEIYATGSIGSGKSAFTAVGVEYDLCKLLLLNDPQATFRLRQGTRIEIVIVNVTLEKAKDTTWDEMRSHLEASPFFAQRLVGKPTSRGATFEKNIRIRVGSRTSHILGNAVFSVILEEINFQDKIHGQAYQNYTNARRRMESRFPGTGGRWPGKIWIPSSSRRENDFLETHIETMKNDPLVKIFSFPQWEMFESAGKAEYGGERFKMFLGSSSRDPFVIYNDEAEKSLSDDDRQHILSVPIEYLRSFEQDPASAIQDIAGITTRSGLRWMYSWESVLASFKEENLFTKDEIELSWENDDDLMRFCRWNDFIHNRKNKDQTRYVHLDLAFRNDLLGICLCHQDGFVNIEKNVEGSFPAKPFTVRSPIVRIDGVAGLRGVQGQALPLFKVRGFLRELHAAGVHIVVSADLRNMAEYLFQMLKLDGIRHEYLSVDKTKEPYNTLKQAILEGRVRGVMSPLLLNEMRELRDMGKMFDHPRIGSKDLADALAGSVSRCLLCSDESVYGTDRLKEYMGLKAGKQQKPPTAMELIMKHGKRVL